MELRIHLPWASCPSMILWWPWATTLRYFLEPLKSNGRKAVKRNTTWHHESVTRVFRPKYSLGTGIQNYFELNDASTKQVIQIALSKMEEEPPVKFTWLSMGSQGRGEQLLNTDQDNAIIFENVPEEKLEATKSYFLKLGERISKMLNTIGFEYCPADMMASNRAWCHSLSEWKNYGTLDS